jgi:lysozyme
MWGAYHYGLRGNVDRQVDHFLTTVDPDDETLLVLDFESTHHAPQMRRKDAEKFVKKVHDLIGRWPGLYTGQSFINSVLGDDTSTPLANCWLWIARYNTKLPKVPPAWSTFTMWQYTDGSLGPPPHKVSGIGLCDRNKFNGDLARLMALWGH